MRQRVMIAIALSCRPKLLIADEPTTALDVTIQAQILDLMKDLKTKVGAAIILITHDLGIVAEVAERVMVMYAGRKVEEAPVAQLFRTPRHPYTQGLFGAVPKLGSSLSGTQTQARRDPGRGAEPQAAHRRLRVRQPLRLGHRSVPAGGAGARERRRPATSRPATTRPRKRWPHDHARCSQVNDLKKHFQVRSGLFGAERGHGLCRRRRVLQHRQGRDAGAGRRIRAAASRRSGRCILRLFDITAGQVVLDGQRIDDLSVGALRPLRRRVQVVFQDPFSSLNPRLRCATSWPSRCATSASPNPAPISRRALPA